VNLRAIEHLVAQSVTLRAGPALPVTRHVRQLTGQDPITFAEFAQQHQEELTPGAQEHARFNVSLTMKVMATTLLSGKQGAPSANNDQKSRWRLSPPKPLEPYGNEVVKRLGHAWP